MPAVAHRRLDCWSLLRASPPIIVRLAARRKFSGCHTTALSHEEIAIEANIPLVRVIEISEQFDWDGISVTECERFCAACRFDPTNSAHREQQYDYIRSCLKKSQNHPPRYLRRSHRWQDQFLPLIRLLKSRSLSATG